MVISDFPDSEYVFSAYVLKGALHVSEFLSAAGLINIYSAGLEKSSDLLGQDDYILVDDQLNFISNTVDDSLVEIEDIFTNITERFDKTNNYREHYTDLAFVTFNESYRNDLSFFENVGYPIPTNSEVEEYIKERNDSYVVEFMLELSDKDAKPHHNYLPLFFLGAVALFEDNITIAEDISEIVMDVTGEDPYNEYRVRLEELMNRTNESNENNGTATDEVWNDDFVSEDHESKQTDGSAEEEEDIAFEWAAGVKEEFEDEMVQRGYVHSKDEIVYRNGYIGNDGDGYLEAWSIAEEEDWYIVTVNVKTGWFHG